MAEKISESIDHLCALMRSPPESSVVMTFTPDDARWILENLNNANRAKKVDKIKLYSLDMRLGNWLSTGDTIKFSHNRLLDGQNRLHACVLAGVPFQTHVVFGVQDDVFPILDRGKARSASDVLHIAGYQNCTALASGARWAAIITDGKRRSDFFEPSATLFLVAERFVGIENFTRQADRINKNTGCPKGFTTGMLYLTHKIDRVKGVEFANAWEASGQVPRGNPLRLMLNALAKIKSLASGRVHEEVRAAFCIKAWNLFVVNKPGSSTIMKHDIRDPLPEMAGLKSPLRHSSQKRYATKEDGNAEET